MTGPTYVRDPTNPSGFANIDSDGWHDRAMSNANEKHKEHMGRSTLEPGEETDLLLQETEEMLRNTPTFMQRLGEDGGERSRQYVEDLEKILENALHRIEKKFPDSGNR